MKSYILLEKDQINLMKQGSMHACVLPLNGKTFGDLKIDEFYIDHSQERMLLCANEKTTGKLHTYRDYLKNVGDLLYVKETFWHGEYDYSPDEYKGDPPEETFFYAADGSRNVSWFSARTMHKALSRFTLQITDIKVSRIMSISDADIHSMGLIGYNGISDPISALVASETKYRQILVPWEDRNPWVLLVKFNVIKKNILEVQKDLRKTLPSLTQNVQESFDLKKALKDGLSLEFSFDEEFSSREDSQIKNRHFIGKIIFENEVVASSKIRVN